MSYCKAKTKGGLPCRGHAMSNGYCYRHNPDISTAEKKQASSRGGNKPTQVCRNIQRATAKQIEVNNLQDILHILVNNTNDVRSGNIDHKVSNAVVQNVNAMLKTYQLCVLEKRVSDIEQSLHIDNNANTEGNFSYE